MKAVLVIGGLPESLLNFRAPVLRALRSAGFRVYASAAAPFPAEVAAALQSMGVEVRAVPLARAGLNPLADLWSFFVLWRLMLEIRPEAVLCYTAKPVIYGGLAAWAARVPSRCAWITGLGYGFTEGPGIVRRGIRSLLFNLYSASLHRYRTVLFQNRDDAELFRRLNLVRGLQRVVVTAGSGIDVQRFEVVPLPDTPVFLLAARLLRDKGIYEYAGAAAELRKRYPEARFLLAGGMDPNPASVAVDDLEAWQRQGAIEFVGWQEDIRAIMSHCRIYVLPSYREGMPRSVLEAMAMGRPVITTDAPGCRDAISPNESGLLVPVRDSLALARAMERFILEPQLAAKMGAKARIEAVSRFDASAVSAMVVRELLPDLRP